ncbi:hypothetical protein LCGC14_1627600 [marine sediment metagenome]|uniref:Uncharacterized protein n=1 Tax=marine sediment metagenome TaxID=412755 RepID=A0A0F9IQM3_9ZZZZ
MPKINKRDQFKALKWECVRPGMWVRRSEELKGQVVAFVQRLDDFGGWWVTAWPMSFFTDNSSFQAGIWGVPRTMHLSNFTKARAWGKRINELRAN